MPKTILAVDDSPSVRQMVRFILEREGHSVIEANDGEHALEVLDGKGVDLVITDLNMPHLGGIGLIKKLRKNPEYKFTPILVFTTESQETKKSESKDAGATGWIVKPFTAEQLLKVVKKLIR